MMMQKSQLAKCCVVFIGAFLAYACAPVSMSEPSQKMLGIFVFAALSWGLDIFPLFVTSMVVVVAQTLLLCGGEQGPAYDVFMRPWGSSLMMLFLSSLILAAVLQKYHLGFYVGRHVLRICGARPYAVLWGFMATTVFFSMWMSNTASTAIMLVLVKPVCDQLPDGDPFKKALVLAVAFAANVGSMITPVGTPPNILAMGLLEEKNLGLSFGAWIGTTLPLAVILLVVVSVLVYTMFPPQTSRMTLEHQQEPVLLWPEKWTLGVMGVTVLLWMTVSWHHIPVAVVGLSAVAVLALLGCVESKDIHSLPWDILLLIWGGLALGEGLENSGLATWVVSLPFFQQQHGDMLLMVILVTMVLSSFMSNTATASILLPIVINLPGQNGVTMAIAVAVASSIAMPMPISSVPNTMALSTGFVTNRDIMKVGSLATLVGIVLMLVLI